MKVVAKRSQIINVSKLLCPVGGDIETINNVI